MPFPVIGFLIGFVIGLMASPSIELALMCGVFVAMLVWAFQGFPIAYKSEENSNEVSIYAQEQQHTKNSTPARQEYASPIVAEASADKDVMLVFNDGAKITSQELGYLSFKWSCESADLIIDLFAPGKTASAFPASTAIIKSPFTAKLYLILFHTAIYLYYLTKMLRVPTESFPCFFTGLNDALLNVRTPSGCALTDIEREKLLKTVEEFSHAIDHDFAAALTSERGVIKPGNAQATDLVIDMLLNEYTTSENRSDLPMCTRTYGLARLLDHAPVVDIEILQNDLGLRMVSES